MAERCAVQTRPGRWCALLAALGLLAGCATRSPAPQSGPTVGEAAPSSGRVLGRSERFVIYEPARGDTLRSIAATFLGSEGRDWRVAEFNGVAQAEVGRPLVVPLEVINPVGVHADHYQAVPILCYHRFGNGSGKMVVSAASFAAQLEWLARNDYRVIRLAQLAGFLEGREPLPRRSVVITIDDGYESVRRVALPLLRKYNVPATVFVYTDFIGAADALSWTQLEELAASGLVDVQSHSRSHRNLIERGAGEGDERYRQRLKTEVRVPGELIERRLPVQVRHYAYPYGDANQALLDVLERERYQLGLTVNPGGNGFFAQPLMLRRTMIYGDLTLATFRSKLQTARGIDSP